MGVCLACGKSTVMQLCHILHLGAESLLWIRTRQVLKPTPARSACWIRLSSFSWPEHFAQRTWSSCGKIGRDLRAGPSRERLIERQQRTAPPPRPLPEPYRERLTPRWHPWRALPRSRRGARLLPPSAGGCGAARDTPAPRRRGRRPRRRAGGARLRAAAHCKPVPCAPGR